MIPDIMHMGAGPHLVTIARQSEAGVSLRASVKQATTITDSRYAVAVAPVSGRAMRGGADGTRQRPAGTPWKTNSSHTCE